MGGGTHRAARVRPFAGAKWAILPQVNQGGVCTENLDVVVMKSAKDRV